MVGALLTLMRKPFAQFNIFRLSSKREEVALDGALGVFSLKNFLCEPSVYVLSWLRVEEIDGDWTIGGISGTLEVGDGAWDPFVVALRF